MSSILSISTATGVNLQSISIFTTATDLASSIFLSTPFIPLKSPVFRRTTSPILNGIINSDLSNDFATCIIIFSYSSWLNGIGRVSAHTINLTPGVFLITYRILSFILDSMKTYPGYNFLVLVIFSHFLIEYSLTTGDK